MNTYPVNLILNKRSCLIVGGGKVAARKLKRLLESGANVTVVAAKPAQSIRDFGDRNILTLHEREFRESDLDGVFLVYLATDDRKLNREVLEKAKSRGIIACSVDRHWKESSFITPASFQNKEITVAVSSQGVACRKTKLIKENLARHIEAIENTQLIVLGTDHNHLALEHREGLHLSGERLVETGDMINRLWGIQGFALLNTCNRVELIAAAKCDGTLSRMLLNIMGFSGLKEGEFYLKKGSEAYRHLCLTAAGLYSQTPGENHIITQFKQAFEFAVSSGWAGSMMKAVRNMVHHCAKKIRQATESILKQVEIEDLAVDFLTAECSLKANPTVAIIGSGMVGTGLLDKLMPYAGMLYWGYNKRQPVCKYKEVNLFQLKEADSVLPQCDLVITAVTSPDPVIGMEYTAVLKKNCTVIDLGMPRNVDDAIAETRSDISIFNMDDLKHWHRRKNCDMRQVFDIAEEIINIKKVEYERFVVSISRGCQK
ncbi:NAD(P)-dependent oxidoreductase [Lentisphaerota bacterium ZTH]|nr:hypothetical protein JYG24_02845 [Lentisphaerota bacterium]WET07550.1 NAD(P)-dependent oxidoreductase [Lentisphaerota bacterium ZTH]